jgi:hypothetical protein
MQIFMSYRRSDSADVSGRIYDRLAQHFGADAIFKDVDDIPFGVNFKTYLNDMVEQCDIQLVIIGPDWLEVTDAQGHRRLDNPGDFVRIEVEAALSRDIPVIPLLVGGAIMPPDHSLPDDIKELSYRNGLPIRADPDFHRDMSRLINGLERYVELKAPTVEAAYPAPQPTPDAGQTPSPVATPAPMPEPSPPQMREQRAAKPVRESAHQEEAASPFSPMRLPVIGVGTALIVATLGLPVVPSVISVCAALVLGPVPAIIMAGVGAGIGAVLRGWAFIFVAANLLAFGAMSGLTGLLGWKKGWGGMLFGAAVGELALVVIITISANQTGGYFSYYPYGLSMLDQLLLIVIVLLGVILARWLGPRIPVLRDW